MEFPNLLMFEKLVGNRIGMGNLRDAYHFGVLISEMTTWTAKDNYLLFSMQ